MKLEIHKSSDQTEDVQIEVNEVFPEHYDEPAAAAVCESEAQALYDALKAALPERTKMELTRLLRQESPRA